MKTVTSNLKIISMASFICALLLNTGSANAGAEYEISSGQSHRIVITGEDARELYEYLPFDPVIRYGCLERRWRNNYGGGYYHCVRYSDRILNRTKSQGSSLVCKDDLEINETKCHFNISGQGLFDDNSFLFRGDSKSLAQLLKRRDGSLKEFQSSSGNFGFRCDELVLDRLYDCFYKVEFFTEDSTSKVFPGNYFQPYFKFEGEEMTESYIRFSAIRSKSMAKRIQKLGSYLKDPTNEDRVIFVLLDPYSDVQQYSDAVISDLKGKVVSTNQSRGYATIKIALDAQTLRRLANVFKPNSDEAWLGKEGLLGVDLPFGSYGSKIKINLNEDISEGYLEIKINQRTSTY